MIHALAFRPSATGPVRLAIPLPPSFQSVRIGLNGRCFGTPGNLLSTGGGVDGGVDGGPPPGVSLEAVFEDLTDVECRQGLSIDDDGGVYSPVAAACAEYHSRNQLSSPTLGNAVCLQSCAQDGDPEGTFFAVDFASDPAEAYVRFPDSFVGPPVTANSLLALGGAGHTYLPWPDLVGVILTQGLGSFVAPIAAQSATVCELPGASLAQGVLDAGFKASSVSGWLRNTTVGGNHLWPVATLSSDGGPNPLPPLLSLSLSLDQVHIANVSYAGITADIDFAISLQAALSLHPPAAATGSAAGTCPNSVLLTADTGTQVTITPLQGGQASIALLTALAPTLEADLESLLNTGGLELDFPGLCLTKFDVEPDPDPDDPLPAGQTGYSFPAILAIDGTPAGPSDPPGPIEELDLPGYQVGDGQQFQQLVIADLDGGTTLMFDPSVQPQTLVPVVRDAAMLDPADSMSFPIASAQSFALQDTLGVAQTVSWSFPYNPSRFDYPSGSHARLDLDLEAVAPPPYQGSIGGAPGCFVRQFDFGAIQIPTQLLVGRNPPDPFRELPVWTRPNGQAALVGRTRLFASTIEEGLFFDPVLVDPPRLLAPPALLPSSTTLFAPSAAVAPDAGTPTTLADFLAPQVVRAFEGPVTVQILPVIADRDDGEADGRGAGRGQGDDQGSRGDEGKGDDRPQRDLELRDRPDDRPPLALRGPPPGTGDPLPAPEAKARPTFLLTNARGEVLSFQPFDGPWSQCQLLQLICPTATGCDTASSPPPPPPPVSCPACGGPLSPGECCSRPFVEWPLFSMQSVRLDERSVDAGTSYLAGTGPRGCSPAESPDGGSQGAYQPAPNPASGDVPTLQGLVHPCDRLEFGFAPRETIQLFGASDVSAARPTDALCYIDQNGHFDPAATA
ncbi:MAG: hypothetical protein ACYCWW_20110, partial [Deltaproteobacteria bacterium]